MKRILLSVMTFVAFAIGANAAEPTYTAVGTVGVVPEGWESYPSLTDKIENVDVEVYGSDSIIVRKWCGVDDYDLVLILGDGADVKEAYCWYYSESAAEKMAYSYTLGYYSYVYTGLNNTMYGMYLCLYTGYTQWEKDDEAQTGSVASGYATGYNDDGSSSLGGYYVSWKPKDTGISKYIADPEASKSSATFNLSGQRVSSDSKGLVIKGGKKMIVR